MAPFRQNSPGGNSLARLKRSLRTLTNHQYYRKRLMLLLGLAMCALLIFHFDQSADVGDINGTHYRNHHHHRHHLLQHHPPRSSSGWGEMDKSDHPQGSAFESSRTQIEAQYEEALPAPIARRMGQVNGNSLEYFIREETEETRIRTTDNENRKGSDDARVKMTPTLHRDPENVIDIDAVPAMPFLERSADDVIAPPFEESQGQPGVPERTPIYQRNSDSELLPTLLNGNVQNRPRGSSNGKFGARNPQPLAEKSVTIDSPRFPDDRYRYEHLNNETPPKQVSMAIGNDNMTDLSFRDSGMNRLQGLRKADDSVRSDVGLPPRASVEESRLSFRAENLRQPGQGMSVLRPNRRRRRKCMNDGIYWSSSMAELLPKGLTPHEADAMLHVIKQNPVTSLSKPSWNRCGRPKNAVAQILGGPVVCARYRAPHTQLVFGEVMSYWLSRFLGLDNVPPVALSLTNSSQWSAVTSSMRDLVWQADQYTALITWIENIGRDGRSRTFMPEPILDAIQTGQPWMPHRTRHGRRCLHLLLPEPADADGEHRGDANSYGFNHDRSASRDGSELPARDLSRLVQWGNLIVFDYITGNYDRVASMLDGAEKERKPDTLLEPIRNLPTSSATGRLWLIDNESGLFDAYDLLYQDTTNGKRFRQFHATLLRSLCVFDKQLIDRVRILADQRVPHRFLKDFAMKHDNALVGDFPFDERLFEAFFHGRLKDVLEWVERCEKLFYGLDR